MDHASSGQGSPGVAAPRAQFRSHSAKNWRTVTNYWPGAAAHPITNSASVFMISYRFSFTYLTSLSLFLPLLLRFLSSYRFMSYIHLNRFTILRFLQFYVLWTLNKDKNYRLVSNQISKCLKGRMQGRRNDLVQKQRKTLWMPNKYEIMVETGRLEKIWARDAVEWLIYFYFISLYINYFRFYVCALYFL